jgi:hypothetical protein
MSRVILSKQNQGFDFIDKQLESLTFRYFAILQDFIGFY